MLFKPSASYTIGRQDLSSLHESVELRNAVCLEAIYQSGLLQGEKVTIPISDSANFSIGDALEVEHPRLRKAKARTTPEDFIEVFFPGVWYDEVTMTRRESLKLLPRDADTYLLIRRRRGHAGILGAIAKDSTALAEAKNIIPMQY